MHLEEDLIIEKKRNSEFSEALKLSVKSDNKIKEVEDPNKIREKTWEFELSAILLTMLVMAPAVIDVLMKNARGELNTFNFVFFLIVLLVLQIVSHISLRNLARAFFEIREIGLTNWLNGEISLKEIKIDKKLELNFSLQKKLRVKDYWDILKKYSKLN